MIFIKPFCYHLLTRPLSLACVLLLGLLPLTANAQELQPVSISYTVSLISDKLGNATLGNLETTLSKTDTGYSVYSETKTQGFAAILIGSNRQERCEFSVEDGRALSSHYSGGKKKTVDYNVRFDWKDKKISFDKEDSLDMPKGYLVDNCNLPFAAALSKAEGFKGQPLYIVDGKKKRIRGYILKSHDKETLDTKIGQFKTLKIVLQREFKPERTLTLWLAPEKNYIPIKMEEKRKSRTTTMLVNALSTS